jgi:hypothetical protein
MPGRRYLKIVTTMTMAPTSDASSVKVINCAHVSERLPGPNSGPESGT